MDLLHGWRQGDAVTVATALLLLSMSVASWVVIVWKTWFLHRGGRAVARSMAAFWQAPSFEIALRQLGALDSDALVRPLVAAAHAVAQTPLRNSVAPAPGALAQAASCSQQLTRGLRDALHQVLARLQFGQVLLATVGATAPFVGLLGTVWGIYHALTSIAGAGQISIDRVAGPVGEALIMTAAGLAVAIPAVLAYNWLGRMAGRIEAELEGFALDLRDLVLDLAHQGA